jgi:hypothetical protein
MYMTDLEGRIRDAQFDEGIKSLTGNADIRVICQNPVLRVLDGNSANIGVYQDVSITDGATINLNTNAEQRDHYDILNRAQIAYEMAFRPLSAFADRPDPDFPLGRKSSLRATRDQAKRIDLSFPDQWLTELSFVEPVRLADNFPLMHIKTDPRIFGTDGEDPILIPHELAHALHFASLSTAQRRRAQDEYLAFILTSPISGVGPYHDFDMRTTPEVAYIEAGGWFAELFMEFIRERQGGASTLVTPGPITSDIQAAFVAAEWSRLTQLRNPFAELLGLPQDRNFLGDIRDRVGGFQPATRALGRALLSPVLTGGSVEGAVYGAIFVDFAATVGLDFAASCYFKANALTFGEYRSFINAQHPEHAETLEEVRNFWGL